MNLKSFLAVSMFLGAMAATTLVTTQSDFDWSPGVVIEGFEVLVKVTSGPCNPVTVTLQIGGHTTSTTVSTPGVAVLAVPPGTGGSGYTISVTCPGGERDSVSGVVL